MAQVTASYPATRNSAGSVTNPTAASSVLADTGALVSALYECRVAVGCSVAAAFSVQHRNAANTSTNETIILRAAAGQTGEYAFKFNINTNERIRVMPAADITGNAEAIVEVVRVA